MNNRRLKNMIRQEIESHIPTTKPQLSGYFESVDKPKKHRLSFSIPIAFSAVFSALLLIMILSLSNQPITPQVQAYQFSTDEEVLSFSALSTTALIQDPTTNPLTLGVSLMSSISYTTTFVDVIEPYLDLAEKFLSDQPLTVNIETSDLTEYTHMISFQVLDLTDKTTTYTMYYNFNTYTNEDNYTFEGILLKAAITYQVIGYKSLVDDQDIYYFKAMTDASTYVESTYSYDEADQQKKFNYKQYEQGIEVSESKIKVEIKDDKIKFKLEFENAFSEGEYEFEYQFIQHRRYIFIEFDTYVEFIRYKGEMTVQIITDELTGELNYRFNIKTEDDEFEYEHHREDEDNDPSEPENSEETEPEEPEDSEVTEPEDPEDSEDSEPEEPEDETDEEDDHLSKKSFI